MSKYIFFTFFLLSSVVSLADTNIILSSPDIVQINDNVELIIKAEGEGYIAGAQIKIIFDIQKLQIVDSSSLTGVSVGNIDNANATGQITIAYLDMSGLGINANSKPVFLTLSFKTILEGTTEVKIHSSSVISDSNMNNISGNFKNTTIKIRNGNDVSGVKIIVQSQENVSLDNTFEALVKASGSGLIAGAQIKIVFDPELLQIQKTSLLTGVSVGNIDNANKNGNITVAYLDMSGEGISADTFPIFATITFTPIKEDITDISIDSSSVISDSEMKNILDSIENATIIIGNGSSSTGVNIEIVAPDSVGLNSNFDIDIKANGKDLIAGAQIKINFDNNKMQLVNINPLSGVSFGSIEKANLNGTITLAYIDMSGTGIEANSNPVFATIHCQAVLSGTTEIKIDLTSVVSDTNMNNISGKFSNSTINIINNNELGVIQGSVVFSIGGHNNLCLKNGEITLIGELTYTTTTFSDGSFILTNIESGEYTLLITAPNLNTISKNVVIQTNETLKLYDLPEMSLNELNECNGIYTQDELNEAVTAERLKWDVNGDKKNGLEEAINSLKVISGISRDNDYIFRDDFEGVDCLKNWIIGGRQQAGINKAECERNEENTRVHIYKTSFSEINITPNKKFEYSSKLFFSFDMEVNVSSSEPPSSDYYGKAGVDFVFYDSSDVFLGSVSYIAATTNYPFDIVHYDPIRSAIKITKNNNSNYSLNVNDILKNIEIEKGEIYYVKIIFQAYSSTYPLPNVSASLWIDNVEIK